MYVYTKNIVLKYSGVDIYCFPSLFLVNGKFLPFPGLLRS